MLNKIFILGLILTLSSCSSFFRRHCNTADATRMGEEDAAAWNSVKPNLGRGNACDSSEYTVSQFNSDYNNGFANVLRRNCDESLAHAQGERDGQAADTSQVSLQRYSMCTDVKVNFNKLKNAYLKGFVAGYCEEDRAEHKAEEDAKNYQKSNSAFIEKHCPKSISDKLVMAYVQTYRRNVDIVCSENAILQKADTDAARKADPFVEIQKLDICPETGRRELAKSYRNQYDKKKLEVQLEEERRKREQEIAALQAQINQQNQQIRMQKLSGTRVDFQYDGQPLYSYCEINQGKTLVMVNNPSIHNISLSGEWTIDYYNGQGGYLSREIRKEYISLSPRAQHEFSVSWLPHGSQVCKAYFRRS